MNLLKKNFKIFRKEINYQKYAGRRRDELSKFISELKNYTVGYGPFQGLKFSGHEIWTKHCLGNMILGLYEKEVMDEIILSAGKYQIFLDVGAADGFFAVGVLLKNIYERCLAYEIDITAQKNIRNLAKINGVEEKIEIFSEFNAQTLETQKIEKCIILIDIEGAEFDLLDQTTFLNLKRCKLIVELHEFGENSNQKISQLIEKSNSTHKFKFLETGPRDLSSIPEVRNLSDNDRWLLCSEGRPYLMRWIVFEPIL